MRRKKMKYILTDSVKHLGIPSVRVEKSFFPEGEHAFTTKVVDGSLIPSTGGSLCGWLDTAYRMAQLRWRLVRQEMLLLK